MKQLPFVLVLLIGSLGFSQPSDFKHINFSKADSIANSYNGETLENLPVLVYKLTNGLDTQVEKF